MQGEVRSGKEFREIRQDEGGEVRLRKGGGKRKGGDRREYVGMSGHAKMREVSWRRVDEGGARMVGDEMWGLGEVTVDELYKYFVKFI